MRLRLIKPGKYFKEIEVLVIEQSNTLIEQSLHVTERMRTIECLPQEVNMFLAWWCKCKLHNNCYTEHFLSFEYQLLKLTRPIIIYLINNYLHTKLQRY